MAGGCANFAAGPRPRPTARREVRAKRTVGDAGPYVLTPRSGISHLPAGEYIALRKQYIAPPTGGISFIAKGDEYEHPSPSRFACHLSPRGEARFGWRGVVRNPRRDQGPALRVAVRFVQILRGVRTIFLGPLTEGAVERMRDWGSLTFNTPSVGYADTSLTREARVLCGFGGDTVGAAICRPLKTAHHKKRRTGYSVRLKRFPNFPRHA